MRISPTRSLLVGLLAVALPIAGVLTSAPASAAPTNFSFQDSVTESDVGGPIGFHLQLESYGPNFPARNVSVVLHWNTTPGSDAALRDVYVTFGPDVSSPNNPPVCTINQVAATATCTIPVIWETTQINVTGTAIDTDGEAVASNGYSMAVNGAVQATGTWHTGEVPAALPTGTVRRVSGSNRYTTAVALAKSAFPSKAGVVFLATGATFPDALSTGPVAAHEGGPLLLTAPDRLPADVAAEISALRPYRVVIVGGSAAVSADVEAEVRSTVPTATVDRLAGANRYDTNRLVIADAYPDGETAQPLWIATGTNYPDALSAAAATGQNGALVLVPGQRGTVDTATAALIARLIPTKAFAPATATIAGGLSAVSSKTQDALERTTDDHGDWARVAGADRYVTSELIARTSGYATPEVYLATGTNFPDALAASAIAGPAHEPLLLSPPTCVPALTREVVNALAPTTITLVGGTSSLSDAVGRFANC